MKTFATIPAIPQAGSLGLELQAYIILAFIVFYNKKLWKLLFASLSLVVFAIAMLQNDVNTYLYAYIYLPGTFFMFLVGVSIYRASLDTNDYFDRYFYVYAYAFIFLLLLYLGITNALMTNFIREELLGFLIGVPIIIYIHNNQKFELPLNKIFGELSYGIFLSHFLVLILFEYSDVNGIYSISNFKFLHVVLTSIIIAYGGIFFIESKITQLRFQKKE